VGYFHSTRCGWYFHCKQQSRNNDPSVSTTNGLHFDGRHRLILLFELGQALGRISAFAHIKLHPRMPFRSRKKYAAQLVSLQQKARRSRPARAVRVVSVNRLFWKILVT